MHLVHIISSLERGGAQAVLYDLVQGLADKKYKQSIIYFHDGPYREIFVKAAIPVYHIKGVVSPFDFMAIYRLQKILKKINPTLLHTLLWGANWTGRIVARMLHIPVIAALHNNYDQNGAVRHLLDRLIPFNNETIIAVSAEVKKTFFHYQKTKSPLIVIENGIDYRALSQTTAMTRDQLGLDPSHCIIGSVGRFAPVKRYPLLLQTFAHLYHDFPQARLLLVGAGPEEHTLRKQAAALGIADSIIWVINVPAAAYYSLMDIFILTSAKEGISIALLEAMSFSVACIITSATKHHPVIENMRNGIVVPHDNATLLLQKMAYLVMNDSVRKQLAKNAQQAVENYFNHHRMVTAYDRLFRIFNLNK